MKKKEKKPKKPSKLSLWHQKMKKTPKGRAYLKLIYWGIFFIALFIFLAISSSFSANYNTKTPQDTPPLEEEQEQEPSNQEVTLEDLETELLNTTYDYSYEILIGDTNYLFEGTKYSTYETGYKTVGQEIIRYYLDDTGTYQLVDDQRILITDFYQGLNALYLDLTYLFNHLNNIGLTQDLTCDCTYPVYSALDEINRYTLNLSDDATSITSLIITGLDNSYEYNLNFHNLGGFDA